MKLLSIDMKNSKDYVIYPEEPTRPRNKYTYYSLPEAIQKFGLREVINSPGKWYNIETGMEKWLYATLPKKLLGLKFYCEDWFSRAGCIDDVDFLLVPDGSGLYYFSDETKTKMIHAMNEPEFKGFTFKPPFSIPKSVPTEYSEYPLYKPKNFLYRYEEA